ncbi:MAG: GIY-YIG nuclease family protein [bacterium]|nr:GIY-YIG nuclease family protein [bacterium]
MACISGIYFLLLRMTAARVIRVGARRAHFPAGWYVYIGSAQRGVPQRVARHLRRVKRRHWHIDYLMPHARCVAVRALPGAPRADEARHAVAFCAAADFVPLAKFGASDSTAPAHLAGFRTRRRATALPAWQRASVLMLDA